MKIGVDAGMLGITDDRLKAGVWRVVTNVLNEVYRGDTKNSYVLYSFYPIQQQFGSNFTNVVLRPKLGWATWRVPMELALHPVDVFLGFGQILPITYAKKIGFVYDLGFLKYPEFYPGTATRLEKQTELLLQRADRIITISNTIKNEIQKKYNKNSVVMPLGVSINKNVQSFKHTNPYILYVGALKPSKNIPAIIAGFEQFFKKSKKVYDLFLVGGDFWPDKKIKKDNPRIKILQGISDTDLATYYKGASAFITLSRTEGFCLPVAEAMAFHLPVVVSDVEVMHETTAEQGIFVNPDDSAGVAVALEKAVGKKITYTQEYSWKKSAAILLEVINSL